MKEGEKEGNGKVSFTSSLLPLPPARARNPPPPPCYMYVYNIFYLFSSLKRLILHCTVP